MARLIFETTSDYKGDPLDPPHRVVRNVKRVIIRSETDDDDAGHTWLVIRNAANNHEIARMWEIGSWWTVGEYSYDDLRIEV